MYKWSLKNNSSLRLRKDEIIIIYSNFKTKLVPILGYFDVRPNVMEIRVLTLDGKWQKQHVC